MMYKATDLLTRRRGDRLTKQELLKLVDYIIVIQNSNYVTKKKKTKRDLLKILDLTP